MNMQLDKHKIKLILKKGGEKSVIDLRDVLKYYFIDMEKYKIRGMEEKEDEVIFKLREKHSGKPDPKQKEYNKTSNELYTLYKELEEEYFPKTLTVKKEELERFKKG